MTARKMHSADRVAHYVGKGWWTDQTVQQLFLDQVAARGDAEAVVDALILRGIGPERLYAIGYGESLPIASNETRAGKQANRRIVFTLADE